MHTWGNCQVRLTRVPRIWRRRAGWGPGKVPTATQACSSEIDHSLAVAHPPTPPLTQVCCHGQHRLLQPLSEPHVRHALQPLARQRQQHLPSNGVAAQAPPQRLVALHAGGEGGVVRVESGHVQGSMKATRSRAAGSKKRRRQRQQAEGAPQASPTHRTTHPPTAHSLSPPTCQKE